MRSWVFDGGREGGGVLLSFHTDLSIIPIHLNTGNVSFDLRDMAVDTK